MQFSIGSTITGDKSCCYNWEPDTKTFVKSTTCSNNILEFKDLVALSELLSDQDILNIFPGKEYTSVFEEQLGIKNTNKDKIPWVSCLSSRVFHKRLNDLGNYLINHEQDLKYYLGYYQQSNSCLTDLVSLNNPQFILNHPTATSFYPDASGDLDIPVYNRTTSITGRLKIVSGPEILSLEKTLRLDLLKNRCFELDFNAIEPRLLYVLATGKPVSSSDDFYMIVKRDLNLNNLTRDQVKHLVLCTLYGSDTEQDNILEYFNIEEFREKLIDERTKQQDGSITNWFGRRIKPPVKNSNIINYYVQSTAIDFVLLCFSWLIKNHQETIKPVFILTDALYGLNNSNLPDIAILNKTIKQLTNSMFPGSEFPVKLSCLN